MNQEEIIQQLQAAVALHNQGELDQAEAIYRQVLSVDANNCNGLKFLGSLLRSKSNLQESIFYLKKAVLLSPQDKNASLWLGRALVDNGQPDEVATVLRKCLDFHPAFPEAYVTFGRALYECQRYEEARFNLEKAVELNSSVASGWGWMNLGNTFKKQEKRLEAIASYRKAIEVKPDFADAYLNLGIVLKEEGEVEEAIASYRKAIDLKPDFADAFYGLAEALEDFGSSGEAIHYYRRNLEVKSEFLILKNSSLEYGSADIPPKAISHIEDALPVGFQLIPSFNMTGVWDEWSSLWHVHIPKTGGMRFYNPLMSLLKGINDIGAFPGKNVFHVSRCHSPFELDAYRQVLERSVEDVDSCIVNVFSVEQDCLWEALVDRLGFSPRRIAFYREPAARLKSALKYIYRINGCRLSAVQREIESRHLHLDNPVVRALSGVFRREIGDDDLRLALQKERVDCFLPLGDFSLGSQIQSAFLSSNSLPNVILPRVINTTLKKYEPSEGEMDSLVGFANSQGLNQWDEQLAAGSIGMDGLEIAHPEKNASLNEWTMIFNSETKEEIHEGWSFVPTCELLADPERWLPAEA